MKKINILTFNIIGKLALYLLVITSVVLTFLRMYNIALLSLWIYIIINESFYIFNWIKDNNDEV